MWTEILRVLERYVSYEETAFRSARAVRPNSSLEFVVGADWCSCGGNGALLALDQDPNVAVWGRGGGVPRSGLAPLNRARSPASGKAVTHRG